MSDIIKLIISSLIVIVGIVGYYYYPTQSELLRVIGVIITVVVALFIAGQTTKGKLVFGFIGAAKQEARKVVWPTKKETNQTTLIVVAAVLILGLILWIIDLLLSSGLKWLIG